MSENSDKGPNREELLKFNVGGKRFITTRTTICQRGQNMLTQLVAHDDDGTLVASRDEKGWIWIDRSGDHFAVILDYLRSGRLCPTLTMNQQMLSEELSFFQIALPRVPAQQRRDSFRQAVEEELSEQDLPGYACAMKLLADSRNSTAMQAARGFTSSRFRTCTGSLFTYGELDDLSRELDRLAQRFDLRSVLRVSKSWGDQGLVEYATIDVSDSATL